MRWLCVIAFVCSAVASGWHDDEDEPRTFKSIVQLIVRSSRENLRPLKTSRMEMRPSMHYWYEVTDVLPGAQTCRIYEHPRMVYKCDWKRSRDAAVTQKRVAKEIGDALGSTEFRVVESQTTTRFEPLNSHRNPLVQVTVANGAVEVTVYPVVRD